MLMMKYIKHYVTTCLLIVTTVMFGAEVNPQSGIIRTTTSSTATIGTPYEFSPDHAYAESGMEGLKESFNEHADALTKNPLAFVIGGMSYDVTPIFDKEKNITGYNIKFSNVTGKNSLLLHKATDVDPVSGRTIPLSNKKQTFTFKITVNEYNKLKEEKK